MLYRLLDLDRKTYPRFYILYVASYTRQYTNTFFKTNAVMFNKF